VTYACGAMVLMLNRSSGLEEVSIFSGSSVNVTCKE
jgi:hypothetical protein